MSNALTPDEIAHILDRADVIETWLKAVRALAHETIEAGATVPGWTLKPKRGVRKWTDENMVKERLRDAGLDGFTTETLVTPAQAEKMAKKQGLQLDFFDLIETSSSGMTLVREDDRQAASAQSASADFGS